MNKTIYRIRGNVLFKLGMYILIAAIAFGTLCMGALVLEGSYIGQFSDDPRNTAYKRPVSEYASANCESMTDTINAYLENQWNSMKKSQSYEELRKYDFNRDGVLNSEDLASLSGDSFEQKLKENQSYKTIKTRGDLGYELYVNSSLGKYQTKAGNVSLTSEYDPTTDNIQKYTYETGLELRTYKYLTFDTMWEMTAAKNRIEEMINSEDEYNDEYDVYGESEVTEAVASDPAQSDSDTKFMYKGMYPVMTDVLYMDGAYAGGSFVTNGYCLMLGYDDYSYINLTGTAYVDMEKAIDNVKAESPEMIANIGMWVNYFNRILVLFAVLAVMCIVCTVISMINAGVKTGKPEITLSRLERIPTEIVVALAAAVIIAGAGILVEGNFVGMCTTERAGDCSFVTDSVAFYVIAFPVACLYAAAVLLMNNLVAKVKAGVLLKDCLVVRVLKLVGGKLGSWHRYVKGHLSLTAQGIAIYIGITILEIIFMFFVAAATGSGLVILLYIIVKWLCIVAIVAFLIQTQELYKCAKEMADGNLSRKADTKKMFWVFKSHGEHLNCISEGLSKAVDERMKSEHLKTELITNVSHDIKTPLTSIINYVDLLQKDNLDEATKQEYIAVLSRQSARLKKLIEDLVEASKASTGNIQINWAEIDANMLLEQAIGEYGDKLDKAGLKIVFTKPDKPAMVTADGQHLWRVFDNLLANISKYAMPGTRVYASVVHDADKVRIEFKNISREALNVSSDELMERFVRGDSSRNTEGSGLGLSIANSLCTLMNAEFSISIDGDLFKAAIIFTDNGTL